MQGLRIWLINYKLINSPIPLRIFFKKPLHNFQIALERKGAMDFFTNFAAVFKRL